jgi:hypothetical protein
MIYGFVGQGPTSAPELLDSHPGDLKLTASQPAASASPVLAPLSSARLQRRKANLTGSKIVARSTPLGRTAVHLATLAS